MAVKGAQSSRKNEDDKKRYLSFGIRQARAEISTIVNRIQNSNAIATIGSHTHPSVAVIAVERVDSLFGASKTEQIASLIVENFLGNAPWHIRSPLLEELKKQTIGDLLVLFQQVKKPPLSAAQKANIERKLRNKALLQRLLKSFKIAKEIAAAEKEGLYETNEHFAGDVELE